ncbi:MAG: hypothetical protein JKX94_12790, partial [Sneathiella sp.]|nr:hypothetical protein [Sneathiella sp.]
LFSFSLVFGSMALAFDVVRYFAVQSRIENTAGAIALFTAKNRRVISDNNVDGLAQQIASLEIEGSSIPSFQSANLHLDRFTVMRSEDGADIQVTLGANLPVTLMQAFNFFEDIEITETATAHSSIENSEIVLVVDRSEAAGLSGKMTSILDAANIFSALLVDLKEGSVKLAIVPYGNIHTNVSPYSNWVPQTDWPTQIPPNVPGLINWTGPLTNQRWCVGVRSVEIAPHVTPSDEKFPLILNIDKEAGPTPAEDLYSIATTEECSAIAVRPLQDVPADLSPYFLSLSATGETANGTAMLWAERLLSPTWREDWKLGNGAPADYGSGIKKNIVMITASANQEGTGQDQIFEDSCARMKVNGIRTFIVNFETSSSERANLMECASTTRHYYSAADPIELIQAMKNIVKSLMTVRLVEVN